MDDVYISDPRQASAQAIAQKQKDKQNSLQRRNFRQYFFDLIIKTLICTVLIAINFTLFAEAGSYDLFDINLLPTLEVQFIYAGIATICLAVMLLLSFSAFLQNLVIAGSFALLVLALFTQFALFDPNSILYGLFGTHIDASIANIFIQHSDWLIAGIVAFVSLILISYTSRSNQVYLLGTLLLILGGIISEAYFNPVSRAFETKPALHESSKLESGRNFIFLALPDFSSYADIKGSKSKNYTVNQANDNLLAFYNLNNFTHYPNAYVEKYNNEFMNLVASLNPNLKDEKIENNLLENVVLSSYWDFRNLDNDKLYLKNSQLYNTFAKNDYNIKVFETRGIDLCNVNNSLSVQKCVEKINTPISLNRPGLSTQDKTILLTAQWLESTGIVSNINLPLLAASYLNNMVEPLNFSATALSPLNSYKILDLITDDIKNAAGNNAYFAVLDLPSSTYLYDDYCSLKNPYQWMGAEQQPWVKNTNFSAKQQAYAEQTNCLIGKLENFIQELEKADKLKQSVIVLQGLNPAPVFLSSKGLEDFPRVSMAIYDPLQRKAETKYELCPASAIISSYLYKKEGCEEASNRNMTDNRRVEVLAAAHKQKISDQKISNAVNRFKEWYQGFAAHNRLENNLLDKEEVTTPSQSEEVQEIKEIPIAAVVEELPKEETHKSISVVAAETAKAEEAKPEEPQKEAVPEVKETPKPVAKAPKKTTPPETIKPLSKPELLKKQFKEQQKEPKKEAIPLSKPAAQKTEAPQVKIEVNVVENAPTNEEVMEVVPPALLGELEYLPLEKRE